MKRITFFLFLALAAITAQAQLYIGLHGGVTLPTGYYGESSMCEHEWMLCEGHQKKAGAGTGFAAGIDISFAMPFYSNLEVLLQADYLQSNPSKDVQEYYETVFPRRYANFDDCSYTLPKYRHIPILAGVRYSYPMGRLFDLYGEAMCGVNIRMISDLSQRGITTDYTTESGRHYDEFSFEEHYSYDNSLTFALQLGVGILIKSCVTVGANFCWLGSAPLTGTKAENNTYTVAGQTSTNPNRWDITPYDINPTMVTVKLGFRLPVWSGAGRVQDF